MTLESVLTLVGTVVGTLGGWEAVKFLLHRRQNKRIAEAQADGEEFKTIRETVEFLQEQLHGKEERFAQQTDRLRKVQDELFELQKQKAAVDLELQTYRCVVRKCPKREPQNGY